MRDGNSPRLKSDCSPVLRWIATLGPVGRAPVAPGTFGSLVGIPLALLLRAIPFPMQLPFLGAFFLLALISSREFVKTFREKDPPEVVIDEVIGFLLASWLLPAGWVLLAVAFLAFRICDIVKPYPASLFDRRVRGGFGIVMDDVVAGVYANLLLRTLLWFRALPS